VRTEIEETNDGIKIPAVTLCFLWGTSWKHRNSWQSEHNNRARCTEFVEQRKNYRDSNGASASQVWCLHTFLNFFFISEFCFSMISLLISPQNFVDISYFKRVMHELFLEFISLDLSTSTVWYRPHVVRSLSVWSCACVLWWCLSVQHSVVISSCYTKSINLC
jgi:hypothetical protein